MTLVSGNDAASVDRDHVMSIIQLSATCTQVHDLPLGWEVSEVAVKSVFIATQATTMVHTSNIISSATGAVGGLRTLAVATSPTPPIAATPMNQRRMRLVRYFVPTGGARDSSALLADRSRV